MPEGEQGSEEEASPAGAEDGPGERREEAPGERHEQQPAEGADQRRWQTPRLVTFHRWDSNSQGGEDVHLLKTTLIPKTNRCWLNLYWFRVKGGYIDTFTHGFNEIFVSWSNP